eukprot:509616-Pleurochrysis_carterae.AAC.1
MPPRHAGCPAHSPCAFARKEPDSTSRPHLCARALDDHARGRVTRAGRRARPHPEQQSVHILSNSAGAFITATVATHRCTPDVAARTIIGH